MRKRITALAAVGVIAIAMCSCSNNAADYSPSSVSSQLQSSVEFEYNTSSDKIDGDENFREGNENVTDQLQNLGINNGSVWSSNDYETAAARNVFDMIEDNGTVWMSCGNYNENKGPVLMCGYTRDSDKPIAGGVLNTEQVNELYRFDGYIFGTSVDPKSWRKGEVYYSKEGSGKWGTVSNIMAPMIHCYDMVKFHGKYFFCGSTVEYVMYNGESKEGSKAAVFMLDGDFSPDRRDYKELKIKNPDGEYMKNGDGLYSGTTQFGTYTGSYVPRMYQFFVFGDKLYGYHYGHNNDPDSGIYVYDEANNEFTYAADLKSDLLKELHSNTQDKEKIQHDFEWKGKYYFVAAGLYSTADFKSYKTEKIAGFEDYKMRDVIFREGYAICLASKENSDETHSNVVLKTSDFESYTQLFNFDTTLFARSFEYADGAFFFALGFDSIMNFGPNGNIIWDSQNQTSDKIPKHIADCGRVYRYIYKK